jgi:peptide/nickel transport system permease protein
VWALRGLYVLLFIALFGDFLAGDKPIFCKIEGEVYFPVFQQYAVDLGLTNWERQFVQRSWSEQTYEMVVFPLVPYSARGLDLDNVLKGPFDEQQITSTRWRHWLGTDKVGRDVAAGMVRGTRVSLIIGVVAMGIATLIGLLFGGLAGYFGDHRIKISYLELMFTIIGILLGIFYGFIARAYELSEGHLAVELILSLLIFTGMVVLFLGLARLIHRVKPPKRRVGLPIDILVMRLIEVMNSVPALIFLLAILAVLDTPSIINVMVIIGFISWTGVARFVRAELLKVRSLDYIEAARSLGLSDWQILFKHALPNALTPILITIAFGIAGAILVEAFISFLGVGLPPEEITWGKLLNLSRNNINAWWLAVFPGFAIFITVTIFNLIGEGLSDALNPRLKQ